MEMTPEEIKELRLLKEYRKYLNYDGEDRLVELLNKEEEVAKEKKRNGL